jgi:ornithine cyclodeaminase/alanine dehydrogenase-like protein (mu-crystallin family)
MAAVAVRIRRSRARRRDCNRLFQSATVTSTLQLIEAAEIDAVLPIADCVDLMEDTLRALDAGAAVQPLRTVLHLPDGAGSLYTMPAFTAAPRALATKLITIWPGNDAKGMPTHQGLVVVFDPDTGAPTALVDAARLTAIRTAAVSAVATRALARPDARDLAILGAGVQARPHLEALLTVRPFRRVRIWSRTPQRSSRLAAALQVQFDIEVASVADARDAVAGADVVCTLTSAPAPVLQGEWLSPGVHVNAIGASTAQTRELDSAAVARARIFVDSVEGAQNEAGDLLIPWQEGRIGGPSEWTPLGAVLRGSRPGRESPADITLFESLGLAVEDAAAASVVAARIRNRTGAASALR